MRLREPGVDGYRRPAAQSTDLARYGMTRRRLPARVRAWVLPTLLLAACGSGGNGEADKQPDQILQDAGAALKAAKSFHLVAVVDNSGSSGASPAALGGTLTIAADVVAPNTVSGTMTQAGVTGHFAFVGGKVYLQGHDFLAKLGGDQAASIIGDRWVVAPASAAGSGVGQIADMQKFADCLVQNHGTLSKTTGTVNGQAAVVLTDKGDKPATQPGRLYVAVSGTAYPLKLEITGATTAGTPANSACASSGSSTGSLTFSDYGKSYSIAAPSNAVDFSSSGG
jgi:hypothetical protein